MLDDVRALKAGTFRMVVARSSLVVEPSAAGEGRKGREKVELVSGDQSEWHQQSQRRRMGIVDERLDVELFN